MLLGCSPKQRYSGQDRRSFSLSPPYSLWIEATTNNRLWPLLIVSQKNLLDTKIKEEGKKKLLFILDGGENAFLSSLLSLLPTLWEEVSRCFPSSPRLKHWHGRRRRRRRRRRMEAYVKDSWGEMPVVPSSSSYLGFHDPYLFLLPSEWEEWGNKDASPQRPTSISPKPRGGDSWAHAEVGKFEGAFTHVYQHISQVLPLKSVVQYNSLNVFLLFKSRVQLVLLKEL